MQELSFRSWSENLFRLFYIKLPFWFWQLVENIQFNEVEVEAVITVIKQECLRTLRTHHPQRQRRPVVPVLPYSRPTPCQHLEHRGILLNDEKTWIKPDNVEKRKIPTFSCSLGNGPPPTRVIYSFTTPIVFLGGMPRPMHTPPIMVEVDVT